MANRRPGRRSVRISRAQSPSTFLRNLAAVVAFAAHSKETVTSVPVCGHSRNTRVLDSFGHPSATGDGRSREHVHSYMGLQAGSPLRAEEVHACRIVRRREGDGDSHPADLREEDHEAASGNHEGPRSSRRDEENDRGSRDGRGNGSYYDDDRNRLVEPVEEDKLPLDGWVEGSESGSVRFGGVLLGSVGKRSVSRATGGHGSKAAKALTSAVQVTRTSLYSRWLSSSTALRRSAAELNSTKLKCNRSAVCWTR